jgi:hypothetical protein
MERLLPDLSWIKRRVSLADVARRLQLDVLTNSTARCWRIERHKNLDRTPSLSFNRRSNRGRCFVCDERSFSNLDLVMEVRQCSLLDAALWISEQFSGIPPAKEKHMLRRDRSNLVLRAGTGDPLIRSGFFATLAPSEAKVLRVLQDFCDSSTSEIKISYAGLARFSGVKGSASIAKAVAHFERIGLLSVQRADCQGLRSINSYRLTPDTEPFQALLRQTFQRVRAEAQAEQEVQAEFARLRRQQRSAPTKVTSLQFLKQGEISRFKKSSVKFGALHEKTITIPVKGSSDSALPTIFLMKKGEA